VGQTYAVIGLTGFNGGIWYYVADDHELDYPVWYPSPLFEVVDGHLSPIWKAGEHGHGANRTVYLAFPEWADDWYFYDRLTDGDEQARRVYRKYKALFEQGL
jgi:hypothetical protein